MKVKIAIIIELTIREQSTICVRYARKFILLQGVYIVKLIMLWKTKMSLHN